ncbi:hypothetical protein R6Q57_023981 [Mikania cordata]
MMELGIVDFLENKVVLITGATGFLAKSRPHAISTHCQLSKDLFKVLKEKHGPNLQKFLSEKVTAVAGDITCEDLGVQDPSLKAQMFKEIDVVVNAAATTNFDERT